MWHKAKVMVLAMQSGSSVLCRQSTWLDLYVASALNVGVQDCFLVLTRLMCCARACVRETSSLAVSIEAEAS